MAKSLQDQLRSLGLVKKEAEAQRKRRPQRPKGQRRADRSAKPRGEGGELSLDRAWALREKEEQRAAQQSRQAKLAEERRRREINARLKALVEPNRRNVADADVARNFLYRGRIRKLYVTAEQQQALAEGRLGIVYLSGSYHLLDAEQLELARAIDAGHVVDLAAEADADEGGQAVPDDLTW